VLVLDDQGDLEVICMGFAAGWNGAEDPMWISSGRSSSRDIERRAGPISMPNDTAKLDRAPGAP